MLVACFLAVLPWLCAVSAVDSSCSDLGEDSEETCALQTQSSRANPLGQFDTSLASGYFQPTSHRYNGKKVFFSKNSCATVLYCLKNIYGTSTDVSAWGRRGPTPQTLQVRLCKLIPSSKWCLKTERDPPVVTMPGSSHAILGPAAHGVCKEANFISGNEGCSQWMIPFMNQLALTLGSSSDQYNLFLDYGSAGIAKCFTPKYNQKCVNASLTQSVQEADIFLYFPDWFCGPSCAIEVDIAVKLQKAGHNLKIIKLNWDDYFDVIKGSSIPSPPNPSDAGYSLTRDQLTDQWRAGSMAGYHILTKVQENLAGGSSTGFIPDGECAIKQNGCFSGKTYTSAAGLECLFKSFGGIAGATACDTCKSAVDSLWATTKTGAALACGEVALDTAPVCGVSNVETAELGFPVCEALVLAACAALEDELQSDKDITLPEAMTEVCSTHLKVCPATDFTRDFCGCLPAGQCTGWDSEKYCCSGQSKFLDLGSPCLRDFHQGDDSPEICV